MAATDGRETRLAEVEAHVGIVHIAAVSEAGGIAFSTERRGEGWQFAADIGALDEGEGGHAGPAAENGKDTAVGAEAVGVAVGEPNALIAQGLQARCHTVASHHGHTGTFPDDQQNIGTLYGKKGVREGRVRGIGIAHDALELGLGETVKLRLQILYLEHRMEDIEGGVEGGMVAELVGGEVGVGGVGGRLGNAAAHTEEDKSGQRQDKQCTEARPRGGEPSRSGVALATEVVVSHHTHKDKGRHGLPHGQTGQHVLGFGNIHQLVGIELGTPEEIEYGVGQKGDCNEDGSEPVVRQQHLTQGELAEEVADQHHKGGNDGEVAGGGYIQPQAMP